MAVDGMSISVELHEGPAIHKVTVENLKQSIKSQGIRGRKEKGRNNPCVSTKRRALHYRVLPSPWFVGRDLISHDIRRLQSLELFDIVAREAKFWRFGCGGLCELSEMRFDG